MSAASQRVQPLGSFTGNARNTEQSMNPFANSSHKRLVRVFVSSTFNDMTEERNELMTRVWPELRRLCQENHVLLGDLDMAVKAEHPEKIGMENCRMAAGLCRMKIDLCRKHGFRECEAAFLRILGVYAMECQDWDQAVELLRDASEIHGTLPSHVRAVCAQQQARTLNNLELAERARERES